jgi:hypothetical protein
LIVFNLFVDIVRGGRPYPLWCCTVEAADRLDGVAFAWDPSWNRLQKDGGGAGVGDRKRAAPTTSAPSAWPTRAPAPSSTGKQTSLLTWFARPTKARDATDTSPSDAGALAAETAPGGADQLDDERALGVGDPLPHDAVDAEMDASIIANYVDPDADINDKVRGGGLLSAANAPAAGNQHADACIASAVEAGEHALEVDDEMIDDAAMYECEYDEDAELEQAINESALEYLADTINTTTTTTTTADNSETDAGHRDKRRRADSPGTTTTTSTTNNINSIPNASHNQNNPITEFHTAARGPAVFVTETDGLVTTVTVFTSRTATGWRISTTTEISCTAAGTRTIINNDYYHASTTSNTSNADSQNIVYNCSNDSGNSDSLTVLVGNEAGQRATTSATSSSAPK